MAASTICWNHCSNSAVTLVVAIALSSTACSSNSNPRTETPASKAETAKPAAPDESRHFPQNGLVKMDIVPDHLLGKSFMPGGNLASYTRGRLHYQQFLGKLPDAQAASFLLIDWKKALASAKYLPHMGGYFGVDETGQSVYLFVKGQWVAGIAGLTESQADPIAREFAARL